MDIGDVDGETVERAGLKDKEFEIFVQRLLKAERALRHRPDAEVRGPVADYHGDDKRDLEFVVHGPPRRLSTDFTAALTWDPLGRTWYSCKGGSSWRSSILTELGQRAYKEFNKSGKRPGPRVRKRPPTKLLDHVESGGRYVFAIGVAAIDDRDLLDEVAKQLRFWLEQDKRAVPAGLRDQLAFIDANRLADFISTHRPELSEEQRRALGLEEPPGLASWAQWTDELGGRDLPSFEVDAERGALFDAIADSSNTIIRVFGPPGVGKTRVVHEGIHRCGGDARDRVRYSGDIDVNLRVVRDDWLRRGSTPWLVLDELRSVDVDQVVARFRANATAGARLFLIGTSDAQTRSVPGSAFELGELGEAETLSLIRSENAALPETQVQAIWHLSEGYPWYAVLLTRGVAAGDEVLEHGDDDATRWAYGTKRVLAGNPARSDSIAQWEREAELRAKTLLVAMLTRDVELEWDELCERHGDGLRLAIAEPKDWDEVVRRERDCRHRQLLRRSGLRATRRYVSPNNLARLILHHFLTDPDLGPKIRRHAPQFRSTLVEIAKSVRVKSTIIERLAQGEWDELSRRASEEGIDSVEVYVSRDQSSYEAARDVPEYAGRALAELLTRMSGRELEAAAKLRAVARGVLEHVVHRKISSETFMEIERALLTLARLDESVFINSAQGIWKSLFLPGLHATHQPWELRLGRLDERLSDPDRFVRGLAIGALAQAVDPAERGLGHGEHDRADGEWPLPTEAELRERKEQLWARLLRACEDDNAELATEAQSAVGQRVRAGVGRGLFVDGLARLSKQVMTWGPAQRRSLLESIADIHRHDLEDFAELPELLEALAEVERAAAPTNLRERVQEEIGSWHPGPWQINDPGRAARVAAIDEELARELLLDRESLDWALDWSTTPEARRARALWGALGRVDRGAGLQDRLVDAIGGTHPALGLACYMLGWAEVGGAEAVEAWAHGQEIEAGSTLAQATLRFLVSQAPNPARLDQICSLVRGGTVVPDALAYLSSRGWTEQLEPDAIVAFIRVIADLRELDEATLGASLELLRRELVPEQREFILNTLGRVLLRCPDARVHIGAQELVVRAGVALAEARQLDVVVRVIVEALAVGANGGTNMHLGHELLQRLLARGHGPALWPWLAEALVDERASSVLGWQLAKERLLAHVPEDLVLGWVGEDAHRACALASLTNPHAAQLHPVVRELLERFGSDGEVAKRLRDRALSTPGVVVGGMVNFERRQLENARAWQRDTSRHVAAWAREIESIFAQRVDEHEARQELRAKYG